MIDVRVACRAGDPTVPNEDSFVAVPGFLAVLDGVSVPAGMDSGCVHGTAWYAGRLAANLAAWYAAAPDADLSDLVCRAIESVCDEHGARCDLDHPGTPQSTLAALRIGADRCDYLLLCDSTVVLDRGGAVETITDRRMLNTARSMRRLALAGTSPVGSDEQSERIRALTLAKRERANRPGGYWIAAANPAAARHAVQGGAPRTGASRLTRAALLTDGAACIVDKFNVTDWPGLLDMAHSHGPDHVVELARAAESNNPDGDRLRLKLHDDATIAYCVLAPEVHP